MGEGKEYSYPGSAGVGPWFLLLLASLLLSSCASKPESEHHVFRRCSSEYTLPNDYAKLMCGQGWKTENIQTREDALAWDEDRIAFRFNRSIRDHYPGWTKASFEERIGILQNDGITCYVLETTPRNAICQFHIDLGAAQRGFIQFVTAWWVTFLVDRKGVVHSSMVDLEKPACPPECAYPAVQPPSTSSDVPVTSDDASEAR